MQTRAVLSEEAAEDAESEAADDVADEELAEETREPAVEYVDRIAHNMALVKDVFGLTTREAEVADLLARGETVARIAAALFISENTVRMHSKHIYTKLDVHKKQQLLC